MRMNQSALAMQEAVEFPDDTTPPARIVHAVESPPPLTHEILLPPLGVELTKDEKEARNRARTHACRALRFAYGDRPAVSQALHRYIIPPKERQPIDRDRPLHDLEVGAAQYRMLDKSEVYPLFEEMEAGLKTYADLDCSLEGATEQDIQTMLSHTAAASILLHTNLRLPLDFTRKNYGTNFGGSPFLEDIGLYGIESLDRIVQLFDYQQGWAFSTYAVRVISSKLGRFVERYARMVYIPDAESKRHRDLLVATKELSASLGREATRAEIAAKTGISENDIHALQAFGSFTLPSLDQKITDADDLTLQDIIKDPRAEHEHHTAAEQNSLHEALAGVFDGSTLTEQQKLILSLRHKIYWSGGEELDLSPPYSELFQQAKDHHQSLGYKRIAKALGEASGVTEYKAPILEKQALETLAQNSNLRIFSDVSEVAES